MTTYNLIKRLLDGKYASNLSSYGNSSWEEKQEMKTYYLIKRLSDGKYVSYGNSNWEDWNTAQYFNSEQEALSFAENNVFEYFIIEKVFDGFQKIYTN